MAIDPTHLPIFGDARPVDPPAPVRAAGAALFAQVGLTGAHLAYLAAETGTDLALFLVPLVLTAAFARSVRAGRDWARAASVLAALLTVLTTLSLVTGPVDLALVALAALLVLTAAHLMYRADVREYFVPADTEAERV